MLVIVPDLPPNINGLGDYAFIQARALQQDHHIKTIFIVAGKKYKGETHEGFEVFSATSTGELEKQIGVSKTNPNVLHLHYVGYGYERRGTPSWLLQALNNVKQKDHSIKLITTFHELYAGSNKPWTSAFWLRQTQKQICKELYLLSDAVITTTHLYAELLKEFGNKTINIQPVFSNVGENISPVELDRRERTMIIFSKTNIEYSFDHYNKEIAHFCQQHQIKKIITIGNAAGISDPAIEIEVKHSLPAQEIDALMNKSYCCFIGFPSPEWFSKSGVYAAACAHGALPVAVGTVKHVGNLSAGVHYYDCNQPLEINSSQHIANQAWQWYAAHNIAENVASLKNIYRQLTSAN